MKAILILDEMPKRCGDCICYQCGFCLTNFGIVDMDDEPTDWCPLKPMPQKSTYELADDHPYSKAEIMAYTYGITVGRNQVIEEITE